MIKNLRRKFVLINMSLVALVLLIVFSVLCYSDYRQAESEGLQTLELALDRQTLAQPPKLGLNDRRVPDGSSEAPWQTTFVVLVDEDGAVVSVTGQGLEVDDELAEEAAKAALATGETSGKLGSLDLRFLMRTTPDGTKIAFYDLSAQQRSMRNLILTSLGVFVLALAAFYGISLFLSKLALAPVERAWEQQRRFVADASHELKTPLTVILANTGILLSHRADTIGEQSKWVENTRAEAERMKGLVEDMLFLARSDDGRAPAPRSRVNFSDLVLSCTLPFEALAFERGVTLESMVEPE
ncbi:MAG TPA: histidine kinase dimerization/phospho-acceptor domain-containing protein, partial [Oscillospiraceae bacterium]|nr:histidine kinase dimerization/phospho-acceptor domain-containing protein [Oscillospiraceae bacterium]